MAQTAVPGGLRATPELLRISARRLLPFGAKERDRAEALLLRSIDSARRQTALSWELRTAISLAELWHAQGRYHQAIDLLATTRDRFTEGFATADLVKSAALPGAFGGIDVSSDY